MKVFHLNIIRFAAEVVGIRQSEILREAEQQLLLHLTGGHECHLHLRCVTVGSALEELQQGILLSVQIVYHQTELLTVLRHEVCLSFVEQTLVLANVVYLLHTKLRHLHLVGSAEDFLSHIVARVHRSRFRRRHERFAGLRLPRFGIHRQQHSVLITRESADAVLAVDFRREEFRGVGHSFLRELHAHDAVLC